MEAGASAGGDSGGGTHDANLNFGDCFSYALAAVAGEPLLFNGATTSRRPTSARGCTRQV